MSRYRFGDVEFDAARFAATRAGARLSLEPKALDVLRVLVERPGRLVTKDELLDLVWPGVAVTPNALTRVVAQLRRELGDEAAHARYIETVPTRGYRFIADVEALPAPARSDGVAGDTAAGVLATGARDGVGRISPEALGRFPGPHAGWVVAALALVAVVAWYALAGVTPSPAQSRLTAVSDEAGSVLDAVFSPDGRHLAVVSDRSGDFEIYLRELETGASRALTADGMRNVHPAWSPDGRRLAFHASGRSGIWTLAVAGGPARRIAPSGSRPAWSPDGRWIAFQSDEWVREPAQPGSHLLLVPADGSAPPRRLTQAGDPPGGHGAPHWSPDGTAVYFTSMRNGPTDFWSVRVRDGLLTKRADNWSMRVLGLSAGTTGVVAWGVDWKARDGRLIRLGVGDDGPWSGGAPEVLLDGLPGGVRAGSFGPGGRTLALVIVDVRDGVWTVPVTAAGAPAGPARDLGPGDHPAISPDGRHVAYDVGRQIRVKRLDGSGERTVADAGRRTLYPTWRSDRSLFALQVNGLSTFLIEADLETGVVSERLRLPDATSFPRVAPDGDTVVATLGEPLNQVGRGSLAAGTFAAWSRFDGYSFPAWSPDGRRLAMERKVGAHVPAFVADVTTGEARQVSPGEGQFWPGSFSPDGRRLAMSVLADRGVWNVETLDLDSGVRVPVTRETSPEILARYPSWSPRGDTIAYSRQVTRGRLYFADLALDALPATR